jgi:ABC-type amino acid transport substrate-binding protein
VILRPGLADRSVRSLEDLKGLRTGVPAGTLADGILRGWHGGQLVPGLVSLKTRADPLPLLAAGQLDATLIELPKFDAWRARHNDQQLRDSGYRHTLGFNLGYVALAKNAALVAAVNDALDALARENRLERLAAEAGLTWSPPRNPAVMPHITRSVLLGG